MRLKRTVEGFYNIVAKERENSNKREGIRIESAMLHGRYVYEKFCVTKNYIFHDCHIFNDRVVNFSVKIIVKLYNSAHTSRTRGFLNVTYIYAQGLLCKFEKVTYARNAPFQRHALNQNFKGSNKHSPPQTILLQRNGRDANVQRKSEGIAINYERHPDI